MRSPGEVRAKRRHPVSPPRCFRRPLSFPVLGPCLTLLLAITSFDGAALGPRNLAVVYNTDDEDSREVARYYVASRGVPPQNLLSVSIATPASTMSRENFAELLAGVRAQTPDHVDFYALAWTLPYRVECMSLTSAFAFGFDDAFCAKPCEPTRASPYFDSPSRHPYRDHGIRPTMMLAGRTTANVKLVIDRGARSDYTNPGSAAYLVVTPDRARSTRTPRYHDAARYFGKRYVVRLLETDGVRNAFDVMFYFTGAQHVPYLDTLGFLPGALGDHLTSAGGVLLGGSQMSILDWLEAGATASYGAVVEPCNFPQKFPDPPVAMMHYLNGETAIEAYWKSVAWPGQGVFVGEPLARPFATRAIE